MTRAFPLVLLGLGALVGCAGGGSFPSLSPRPVELLSFEEPVRTDPAVASSPALLERAADLLGRARGGDGAFEAAYAQALPVVRGAGPSGSDAWLQAQEAISRVEASRIQTTSALADLDLLLVEQADEPTSADDFAQLRAARDAAGRLVAEQQNRLDGLRASLG